MKTIGLIGNIGSGKSTISNHIRGYAERVGVIDLDQLSKDILLEHYDLRDRLEELFGLDISINNPDRINYVLDTIFPDDDAYRVLMELFELYLYNRLVRLRDYYLDNGYEIFVIEGACIVHCPSIIKMIDIFFHTDANYVELFERVVARGKGYTIGQIHWLNERTNVSNNFRENLGINQQYFFLDTGIGTEGEMYYFVHEILDSILGDGINIGIYAGSFNPLHIGHIDIIERMIKVFGKVIVLRCINGEKVEDTRYELIESMLPMGVKLVNWGGLIIDYLDKYNGMNVVFVRGIRGSSDYEYEVSYVQHLMDSYRLKFGRELCEVMYMGCKRELGHISSRSIRVIEKVDKEYARVLMV